MKVLVVSASLNPDSRSRRLARIAFEDASAMPDTQVEWLDLRELDMQFCDARPRTEYNADTRRAIRAITEAERILFAFPVYNWTCNAAAKNLVELGGNGFEGKRVGLMAAAGGKSSYMAPQTLAQSLILDFRSIVVPRYVYATGADFNDAGNLSAELRSRVKELVGAVVGG
jgi:FMN reductase